MRAGTLTQNEMSVRRMWAAGQRHDDLGWLQGQAASGGSPGLGMDPRLQDLLFRAVAGNSSANIRCGDCGACQVAAESGGWADVAWALSCRACCSMRWPVNRAPKAGVGTAVRLFVHTCTPCQRCMWSKLQGLLCHAVDKQPSASRVGSVVRLGCKLMLGLGFVGESGWARPLASVSWMPLSRAACMQAVLLLHSACLDGASEGLE